MVAPQKKKKLIGSKLWFRLLIPVKYFWNFFFSYRTRHWGRMTLMLLGSRLSGSTKRKLPSRTRSWRDCAHSSPLTRLLSTQRNWPGAHVTVPKTWWAVTLKCLLLLLFHVYCRPVYPYGTFDDLAVNNHVLQRAIKMKTRGFFHLDGKHSWYVHLPVHDDVRIEGVQSWLIPLLICPHFSQ